MREIRMVFEVNNIETAYQNLWNAGKTATVEKLLMLENTKNSNLSFYLKLVKE